MIKQTSHSSTGPRSVQGAKWRCARGCWRCKMCLQASTCMAEMLMPNQKTTYSSQKLASQMSRGRTVGLDIWNLYHLKTSDISYIHQFWSELPSASSIHCQLSTSLAVTRRKDCLQRTLQLQYVLQPRWWPSECKHKHSWTILTFGKRNS